MGLTSVTARDDGDGHWVFGRLEYIRWMIMLGCIYAALESGLHTQQQAYLSSSTAHSSQYKAPATGLTPLMSFVPASAISLTANAPIPLLDYLYRFRTIMQDVHVHLRVLSSSTGNEEGAGLDFDELLEATRKNFSSACNGAQRRLQRAVNSIDQAALLEACPSSSTHASSTHLRLTPSLLSLLSETQAESTIIYLEHLLFLSRSSSTGVRDLLLAHAYVRYLGGLSGGQHIRKRVEKLWPIEAPRSDDDGFAFYSFPPPKLAPASLTVPLWHRELKDCFRLAMDASLEQHATSSSNPSRRAAMLQAQGDEAILAFELTKNLFEGLVGNPTDSSCRSPSATHVAEIRAIFSRASVVGSSLRDEFGLSTRSSAFSFAVDNEDKDTLFKSRHQQMTAPLPLSMGIISSSSSAGPVAMLFQLQLLLAAHPWTSTFVSLVIAATAVALGVHVFAA